MYYCYPRFEEVMRNTRRTKYLLNDDVANEKKFEKIIKQNKKIKKTKKNRNKRRKRK